MDQPYRAVDAIRAVRESEAESKRREHNARGELLHYVIRALADGVPAADILAAAGLPAPGEGEKMTVFHPMAGYMEVEVEHDARMAFANWVGQGVADLLSKHLAQPGPPPAHGMTPSYAIIDEMHIWSSADDDDPERDDED